MKKTILFLAFIATTGYIFAQKKTTTSATVSFDATTEKDALPKAENKTVIGSIDTQTGDVAFEAAVKNFSFPNTATTIRKLLVLVTCKMHFSRCQDFFWKYFFIQVCSRWLYSQLF